MWLHHHCHGCLLVDGAMQRTCQFVFAKSRGMKHLHFGFFDHATGPAGRRQGTCVSKGERIFAQELAGLTERALKKI